MGEIEELGWMGETGLIRTRTGDAKQVGHEANDTGGRGSRRGKAQSLPLCVHSLSSAFCFPQVVVPFVVSLPILMRKTYWW